MIEIKLSQGYIAIVDVVDADLATHKWWPSRTSEVHIYPQRHIGRIAHRRYAKKHLHREIGERMYGGPIPRGWVVDHINGDTLDNRRSNLRVVTHTENVWNQKRVGRDSASGIIGVRQHRKRWQAYICEGRKMITLGSFDTAEEARVARLAAEAARAASVAR
jgi:hypothetical protein